MSIRVAEQQKLVFCAFTPEERRQLMQLLLDDDAKSSDALGDTKGSGNGSSS
jgi:bisphosphoglycerate-independent phosphoglycerate mutase (AlkP superfamily)